MVVDYHTHTLLCKHGEGNVEEYVRRAISLGLDEVGCSEHIPMPHDFDHVHRMSVDEYYSRYAPMVTESRRRFDGRIAVKRGIEADFFAGTESWVERFIEENDFDYVIGSVHFLGEWGFDNPVFIHRYEERDVDALYEDYFETVDRACASGLFDIVAHFDLVKKFGHRPTRNIDDLLRRVLQSIKRYDLCMEINTSGLRKPVKEMYPDMHILRMAAELEIPLTLGSDAHRPDDVAYAFDDAVELVNEYGGGKIATFDRRVRMLEPVSRLRPAVGQRKKTVA